MPVWTRVEPEVAAKAIWSVCPCCRPPDAVLRDIGGRLLSREYVMVADLEPGGESYVGPASEAEAHMMESVGHPGAAGRV